MYFCYQKYWCYPFPNTSEPVMKRESGANPEQTRCCELRLRTEQKPWPLIRFSMKRERLGRRSDTGVSQKTCQYFTYVTWLSGNKA
jgi:hypothetical protein